MIIDIVTELPEDIINAVRWWWLDPSAGWLRVVVLSSVLIPLTNKIVRKLGWDRDGDHDKMSDEES